MINFFRALILAGFLASAFLPLSLQASMSESLSALPVQDGGRIKPFDTFAREYLNLIYGKEKFENKPAVEIVLTWVLEPNLWLEKEIFELRNLQIKNDLKLPEQKRYFTHLELTKNSRFGMLMQELSSKRETQEKLDPYYQAIQRLEEQVGIFNQIASGQRLRLVPPKQGDTWLSLPELDPEQQAAFSEITKAFVMALTAQVSEKKGEDINPLAAESALENSVQKFETIARAANPDLYPSKAKIQLEIQYNNLHPFKWSWIFYILGSIAALLAWILARDRLYRVSWLLVILGFLFHLYGFALRVYLTERPPVSNMYETVIWVGFGAVLFSMIFEAIYKWRFILMAGSLAAAFCLAMGDMAPAVLDPSLQPLEPVLRSNYWLTIHVLTITISYAAFFLGFILADIGVFFYFKGEDQNKEKIKAIVLSIYRSIQVGTAFLAPGIILGGIWADYSWGRFWGWDPKETWALIALLGYIAVLHGRLVGWIKDFGLVVSGIVTFSLVIMAWYGVNFVLGAGLHSYGFGAGGVEYVASFVALHLLAVVYVSVVRFGRLKEKATKFK